MITKYDENPLIEFKDTLKEEIQNLLDGSYKTKYNNIDSLVKLILMNNGCGFKEESYGYIKSIMDNSYYIYFIIGGEGNTINKIYDYIDINGMNYLVIFLDNFIGINSEDDDNIFGKSNYFDNITKLVNIFILSISNPSIFTNTFSTTSIGKNYRNAPYIIAASIIKDINGEISENSVYGYSYDKLMDILNNNVKFALYGILQRE